MDQKLAPTPSAGGADRHAPAGDPAASATLETAPPLEVSVSHEEDDRRWDDFLVLAPGGHHVQSTPWARLKATMGLRAVRVKAERQGEIVAGAQMLVRRVAPGGAVGYVPKGPAARVGETAAAEQVMQELKQTAKDERVRLVLVQPSNRDHALAERLPELGYAHSPFELAPSATCVLDVTRDLNELLAAMKPQKRYDIRAARRKGVTVREGSESDLRTFHQLLTATGQRQGFSVYSEEYVRDLWRVFHERSWVRFALAEYHGEVVSGQMAIAFNDTVLNKLFAWSGAWKQYCPNELLHWSTVEWAKAAGYHWYDFEGIPREAAQAVLRNAPLPSNLVNSVASFKLGFGGQPWLLPETYDYAPNLALRFVHQHIVSKLMRPHWLRKAAYGMRTRGGKGGRS